MNIIEYKVYVKVNSANTIVDINSDAFLTDVNGWTHIDTGCGDRYFHAQNNYLESGVTDINGVYNYKLVEGVVTERTMRKRLPI